MQLAFQHPRDLVALDSAGAPVAEYRNVLFIDGRIRAATPDSIVVEPVAYRNRGGVYTKPRAGSHVSLANDSSISVSQARPNVVATLGVMGVGIGALLLVLALLFNAKPQYVT